MGHVPEVIGLRPLSRSILVRTAEPRTLLPPQERNMPLIEPVPDPGIESLTDLPRSALEIVPHRKKGPQRAITPNPAMADPLLTVEDVGRRLNVRNAWVWDHCWRETHKLPVMRMG